MKRIICVLLPGATALAARADVPFLYSRSAIVYDVVERLSDLPVGWTDEQEAGRYRLRRRNDSRVNTICRACRHNMLSVAAEAIEGVRYRFSNRN